MILAEFFIPHGHCYLWKPELVGLHIVSDALTALAYYSIPLMLIYFVVKRQDVPFNWIFLLFGAFIISCGTTHLMDIWTLWHPDYWLSGVIKAFTAVVSLYTAGELVSLLPQALKMPSAAQFEAVKNEIQERLQAEAALLREKTHLALAQKVANVGSWEFDLATQEFTWSEETFRIYGLHPEQPTPTIPEHLKKIHRDDRAIWDTTVNQLLEKKSCELEFRIVRPDGSIRHLLSQGEPILSSDGCVEKLFGTVLDITERKRAEQAQARLTAILEATPDIVGICDATGRKIYINPAGRQFHGIELDGDITNHRISECHPKEVADFILNHAVPSAIANGVWRGETLWQRWDGEVFPASQVIIAHKSECGEVEYISTIARDISELKRTEAALQESEKRFRAIFEQAAVGIAQVSLSGQFLQANQRFCDLMRYTESELLARTCQELIHPDDRQLATEYQHQMLAGQIATYSLEKRYIRKDLTVQWVNSTVSLVRNAQGGSAYFIKVMQDISARKHAEAALQQQLAAVEAARDGIAILNRAQEFIYLNQAHVKLYGYDSSKQLLGKTWRELYGADDFRHLEDDILPIVSRQGHWHGEAIGKKRDGTTYFQEVSLTLTTDGGLICVCRDITERKLAQAEMIRSKDLLESIFNDSADALFLVNPETLAIADCNQRAVELFEATNKDELLNIHGHTLQKRWFTTEELNAIAEEMKLKGFWSLELEYITKQGNLFWGNLAAKPIHVGSQNINLVRVTDITNRKRTEEALRESLERERAIARAIQRIRQTLDIETIFTATTSELRQLIDCDRVLIYRFNADWSGEIVSESVGHEWISLLQEQANNPNLTGKTLEDSRCSVSSFDSKAGWDSNFRDSAQVQDTYLQETRGGAYSKGASYRVVQDIYKAGFNSCYINLLEQFQARAYIIVPIFLGSKLWGLLATYQNSGSRQWKTADIKLVVEIGNQLGVALQQAELLAQIQKQSEALQQSTQREREKAQELELTLDELRRTQTQLIHTEKMSSLGQMVAGVAHEINNPVSFIRGNLTPAREYFQDLMRLIELYQQTYPNSTTEIQKLTSEIELDFMVEDWSKLMDSMQVGAKRIEAIVRSLKTFSRLDESELKPVDIHEGIENTLLILQHRLRAEGNHPKIQVVKDYEKLPLVTCYASQLNQVFMNVLSNAIDALENQAPPRVITIRTSLSQKSKFKSQKGTDPISNPQYVIIRIADNGTGMNEEVCQKIFDPFFTTKPVGMGTGLGLSISHQIVVEKHKGQISCISALGQGTEFLVEIPVSCTRSASNNQIVKKKLIALAN